MTKDELVNSLQKRDPLLANAVSNMVDYISDRFPAAYPSKEQTEAVYNYLHSVYADEELHHRKLPSMPYKCLTVPNLTDCNVCLTISHTTRSIICQREASA